MSPPPPPRGPIRSQEIVETVITIYADSEEVAELPPDYIEYQITEVIELEVQTGYPNVSVFLESYALPEWLTDDDDSNDLFSLPDRRRRMDTSRDLANQRPEDPQERAWWIQSKRNAVDIHNERERRRALQDVTITARNSTNATNCSSITELNVTVDVFSEFAEGIIFEQLGYALSSSAVNFIKCEDPVVSDPVSLTVYYPAQPPAPPPSAPPPHTHPVLTGFAIVGIVVAVVVGVALLAVLCNCLCGLIAGLGKERGRQTPRMIGEKQFAVNRPDWVEHHRKLLAESDVPPPRYGQPRRYAPKTGASLKGRLPGRVQFSRGDYRPI